MPFENEKNNDFSYEKSSENQNSNFTGPSHDDQSPTPQPQNNSEAENTFKTDNENASQSASGTIFVPPSEFNLEQDEPQSKPETYYAGDFSYGSWQAPEDAVKPAPSSKSNKKRSSFSIALAAIAMICIGLIIGTASYMAGYYGSRGGEGGLIINSTPSPTASQPDNTNTAPGTSTASQGVELMPEKGDTLSISQIYRKLSPTVVYIAVDSGSGSGVIMTQNGYIITNDHVVAGSKKITVRFIDGTEAEAKLIGTDNLTDIAVIKVERTDLSAASFGDSDQLEIGEQVVAIGNPYGLELANTITSGIVSGIRSNIKITDKVMTLIQTNANINYGNSGGPLINMYGQVIGINSAKIVGMTGEAEGLGFAIPTTTLKPVVDDLIQYGIVRSRPMLGISGIMITKRDAAEYLDFPTGLYVQNINKNSDAYKKGLKTRDIIIKINGKEFESFSEFNAEKEKYKIGDALTLTIWRNGEVFDLSIILVENTAD